MMLTSKLRPLHTEMRIVVFRDLMALNYWCLLNPVINTYGIGAWLPLGLFMHGNVWHIYCNN